MNRLKTGCRFGSGLLLLCAIACDDVEFEDDWGSADKVLIQSTSGTTNDALSEDYNDEVVDLVIVHLEKKGVL